MSLAFLLLAHKNARQVERLFRAVHRPEDVVVLHFDRRAEPALHCLGQDLVREHRNVILLRPRTILWGGYKMAAIQMEAMAAALRASDRWHHFINLTGQDFPIKRIDELDTHLTAHLEANYVSWFDPVLRPLWSNARERLERHYFEWPWLDRVLKIPGFGRRFRKLLGWQNKLPHIPHYRRTWPDFRYYGGANHVILSREGCRYLTTDPEARRICRWLRHSAHANEIVFQTVFLNSPLAPTVINAHLRDIDFPTHSPHPRTLRENDFDRLLHSPMFFARKFDDQVDAKILDRLSQHLRVAQADRHVASHR